MTLETCKYWLAYHEAKGNQEQVNFWSERIANKLGHQKYIEIEAAKVHEKDGDVNYSNMTKAQLINEANKLNLDISQAKTKDDLVVILETNSDK